MVVNQKPSGRASSVGAGLAWAGLTSLLMTLAGTGVVAALVSAEQLQQKHIGYGVMVVLLLASWVGAMVAWKKIKRQKLAVCLGAGGVYFAALLAITALFFGAQYSGVGETALLILCGSLLTAFAGITPKPKRNIRKITNRNW